MNKIKKILLTLLTLGTSSLTAFSCNNNEVSKPQETKQPEIKKEEDKKDAKISTLSDDKIRVGHWNVLNYDGLTQIKTEVLAKIIKYNQISIIGLTEVKNDDQAPKQIVAEMKKIDPENDWQILNSNKLKGDGNETQAEYISVLYNANLVKPIPFVGYETITNPYQMGLAYPNPQFKSKFQNGEQERNVDFVRPPFGVRFSKKTNEKENFTLVFTHNDSPGAKASRGEIVAGSEYVEQGSQEIDEALKTKEVMEWFDEKDGENQGLIFFGDTNIKKENKDKPFQPLLNIGYKNALGDDFLTTLNGKDENQYANPYDKIFYKGLTLENSNKYDIRKVFADQIINEQEWKEKVEKNRKEKNEKYKGKRKKPYKPYKNPADYIRSAISDHAPVFTDVVFKK